MELRGYVLHCAEIRLSETRPTQTQTLAQRQKTSIHTRQIQRERQKNGCLVHCAEISLREEQSKTENEEECD